MKLLDKFHFTSYKQYLIIRDKQEFAISCSHPSIVEAHGDGLGSR
jgi:hypothetical protein